MKVAYALAVLTVAVVAVQCGVEVESLRGPPRANPAEESVTKARAIVDKMTLDEKLSLLHGVAGDYVGNTPAVDRLGIPPLTMNDGPQGFRAPDGLEGTSTAFPSGLAIAATFDGDLAYAWGAAMGKEFAKKGSNVQLGPGMCVARVPLNGRNFEYTAGEDPHLGSVLAPLAISGIQDQGVIANAKHYIQNSQETNRMSISEDVDEKTMMDLYMPPFIASAKEGRVGSFMCSYNLINGTYACENQRTLELLKDYAGFDGWVMSDWGATHSTVASAKAGLDQEMPDNKYFGASKLKAALKSKDIDEAAIDDKVTRILAPMVRLGVMDNDSAWRQGHVKANVTSPEHNDLARSLAAASTVLLKNEGPVLPLDATKAITIAVIGSSAQDKPIVHGGGSGQVIGPYVITPLDAITTAAARGSKITYTPTTDLAGAAKAASEADVALVFAATTSTEGADRADLNLSDDEQALIATVAKAQPRTVVTVVAPGAMVMPWAADVSGILVQFMPGQEFGNAVADVLFGRTNPSARLPLTFPNKENEVGFTQEQYPGLPKSNPAAVKYTEKLEIGYRWYDAHGVAPLFPFGHGLSYTSFEYSGLTVEGRTIKFTLRNTGAVEGREVAQLYLGFPSAAQMPVQSLKAFQNVSLKPNESATVTFTLSDRDLSSWCTRAQDYIRATGHFTVRIGASSRDTRLTYVTTFN